MSETQSSRSFSQERLSLLYELSQTFNSSLDLDEVLSCVMDEVIQVIGAERGFVMLLGPDGELNFQAARGIDHTDVEDPEFEISRSVVESVANDGKPLLTSDAQSDDRLSGRTSVMNLKLRSIICAPLQVKGRTIGAIYLDNRLQTGIFSGDDLDFLVSITSTAAIAIENARLYQVSYEKGRMEQDLQSARKVQASLLPQEFPQVAGWDFAGLWNPAYEVAGDFYDFIDLKNDKLGMVIADVVDKGMAAALFMAFSRAIVRASVLGNDSAAKAIQAANKLVCSDSAYGMFLTLAYAEIDLKSAKVTYVNAGHNPPLFYQGKTDQFVDLTRTGMLVGVDEDADYDQAEIHLESGDFILFYTDGVTDAVNAAQQDFGIERLQTAVVGCKDASAEDVLQILNHTLKKFVGDTHQYDDTTVMIVKRL